MNAVNDTRSVNGQGPVYLEFHYFVNVPPLHSYPTIPSGTLVHDLDWNP